jgi:hypothetical protein
MNVITLSAAAGDAIDATRIAIWLYLIVRFGRRGERQ